MSVEKIASELAPQLKTFLHDGDQVVGNVLSAGALGIAGGAGAVYALEHYGRVKAEKASRRHKG